MEILQIFPLVSRRNFLPITRDSRDISKERDVELIQPPWQKDGVRALRTFFEHLFLSSGNTTAQGWIVVS